MYANVLNVPPTRFTGGFPGVTDRPTWFLLDFRGKFTVAKDGDFTFRLVSQDGAILWVDDQLFIDNDGLHEARSKSGVTHLTAGKHHLKVVYFHGGSARVALQLFVTPPAMPERLCTADL
jgi:hypothetical protein